MQRLVYKNKLAVKKYIKKSLNLFQFYKIDENLEKIEVEWDNKDDLSRAERLNNIDI